MVDFDKQTGIAQEEPLTENSENSELCVNGNFQEEKEQGLLPISIVGALLGMLVGIIPSIIGILLFKSTYAVLFLTIPLGICGGIIMLKGYRDKCALILMIIFSLLGVYLTIVIYESAIFAVLYNMSLFNIPLITILMFGSADIWSSFSLNSIYAFIFVALGVWISWEILAKQKI